LDRKGALGQRDCYLGTSGVLPAPKTRPLYYASAAGDNVASIRILQKCGFMICGYAKSFAGARGAEIEKVMLQLEA
jgi:hypothetical protein